MSLWECSLREKFEKLQWQITESFIIDLGCQILDVLEVIHKNGIIHCDIKPENIMFTQGGTLQILDFSYWRLMEKIKDDSSQNQEGIFEGTIYFSARMKFGKITFEISETFGTYKL